MSLNRRGSRRVPVWARVPRPQRGWSRISGVLHGGRQCPRADYEQALEAPQWIAEHGRYPLEQERERHEKKSR